MKKFKFISSIVVLVLVLAAITFAIVAALMPTKGIVNQITFFPKDEVSLIVECEAVWATGENRKITIETDSSGNLQTTNWNAPDINFNAVLPNSTGKREVELKFIFKNKSDRDGTSAGNKLQISFQDIVSDTKLADFETSPRFYSEIKTGDNAKKAIVPTSDGIDDQFILNAGDTITVSIFYTLDRDDANISVDQNIKINIGIY